VHLFVRTLSAAASHTIHSRLSRARSLCFARLSLDLQDSRLAEHVLRMHRYVRPGQEGLPVPLDAHSRDEERDEDKAGCVPQQQQEQHCAAVAVTHARMRALPLSLR